MYSAKLKSLLVKQQAQVRLASLEVDDQKQIYSLQELGLLSHQLTSFFGLGAKKWDDRHSVYII